MLRHLLNTALVVGLAVGTHPTTVLAQVVEGTNLIADTVERVSPSVVNIVATTEVRYRNPIMPWAEGFFRMEGPNNVVPRRGEGSGVIIDQSGLILTNDHVVDGASTIEVNTSNGRKYRAKLKG